VPRILWKSAEKAPLAAEAMAITSERLRDLGLIDAIVPEPLAGRTATPTPSPVTFRAPCWRCSGSSSGCPSTPCSMRATSG